MQQEAERSPGICCARAHNNNELVSEYEHSGHPQSLREEKLWRIIAALREELRLAQNMKQKNGFNDTHYLEQRVSGVAETQHPSLTRD